MILTKSKKKKIVDSLLSNYHLFKKCVSENENQETTEPYREAYLKFYENELIKSLNLLGANDYVKTLNHKNIQIVPEGCGFRAD